MSQDDQDFKTFYQKFKEESSELNRKKKFDYLMQNGKTPLRVNWDQVFYGLMAVALIAKGIHFLMKWLRINNSCVPDVYCSYFDNLTS